MWLVWVKVEFWNVQGDCGVLLVETEVGGECAISRLGLGAIFCELLVMGEVLIVTWIVGGASSIIRLGIAFCDLLVMEEELFVKLSADGESSSVKNGLVKWWKCGFELGC